MNRYIVAADATVLAALRTCLLTLPERFSVIPEEGIQRSDRMLVETTEEGAQQLQSWLADIGIIEPDSPLEPSSSSDQG